MANFHWYDETAPFTRSVYELNISRFAERDVTALVAGSVHRIRNLVDRFSDAMAKFAVMVRSSESAIERSQRIQRVKEAACRRVPSQLPRPRTHRACLLNYRLLTQPPVRFAFYQGDF